MEINGKGTLEIPGNKRKKLVDVHVIHNAAKWLADRNDLNFLYKDPECQKVYVEYIHNHTQRDIEVGDKVHFSSGNNLKGKSLLKKAQKADWGNEFEGKIKYKMSDKIYNSETGDGIVRVVLKKENERLVGIELDKPPTDLV